MKEVKFKIKTYAGSVAVVNDGRVEGKILRAILWSFGVLALCYIFILSNTVWNIVERKSLEKESRFLSAEIGDLELEYLSRSGEIGIELGYSMGFVESSDVHFATRKSLGSLSLLDNEL